jgi:protein TonB
METPPTIDLSAEAAPIAAQPRRRPLRWSLCIAAALLVHGGALAALLMPWPTALDDAVDGAPPVLVELAPVTAAPATQRSDAAPGPTTANSAASASPTTRTTDAAPQPRPDEASEAEVKTEAPAQLPILTSTAPSDPVPLPAERAESARAAPEATEHHAPKHPATKERAAPSHARAPSAAARQARAAAPAPGANERASDALPSWRSELMARLEQSKRYPPDGNGDQGTAMLAFSLDRGGHVHGARIARSSGSAALDRETLALLRRAEPLPAPPPELGRAQVALTVPIHYSLH